MPLVLSEADKAEYEDYLAPPYVVGLIVTSIIMTIILLLRIYAQWLIKNLRAWDNIFAILAFLSLVPLNVFTGWQFTKGAGYHIRRVFHEDPKAPENVVSIFYAWYWITILSAQACAWIKLAMLLFIRRVLPCDLMFFRVSWWAILILTILIGIGATIEFSLVCLPVSFFWERVTLFYGPMLGYPGASNIKPGWCMPMQIYLQVPLIASFITDVFLFLLPLIPLWGMKLPLVKKISVFLTLSLGLFAIGVDCVRIWEIVHFDLLGDVTWQNTPGVAWNAIEYNVALVAACIPAMAPLIKRDLWKRGPGSKNNRRAFMQLGDDSNIANKSDRNLLRASPTYITNDYRVWGDRSEHWRQTNRRESEDESIWSGDTRADSRAQQERAYSPRKGSAGGYYARRTSDSTTITELVALELSPTGKSPRRVAEWI